MTGGSSAAADYRVSMSHCCSLEIPLHSMTAIESNQVIISGYKVQTGRLNLLQINPSLSLICNFYCSGNNISLRKYTVQKHNLHFQYRIFQNNLQSLRLCFICINSRKPLKGIFPFFNLIITESQITSLNSVFVLYHKGCTSVIARSHTWKFLWQNIQRICAVIFQIIRNTGKSSVKISQKKIHTAFGLSSIIQMHQISQTIYLHLISCFFCV